MLNILYIELNTDGTVGGSHFCLLDIVRTLDRTKFNPLVLFYQHNDLIPAFETACDVIERDRTRNWIIKRDLPRLNDISSRVPFFLVLLLLFQKAYNFLRYRLPDFIDIVHLLFRHKIHLVNINNAPLFPDLLLACKLLNVRCVSHFRGTPDHIPFIHRKVMRFHDAVISISEAVTSNARKHKINTRNFVLIHDGIDIAAVQRKRKRDPVSVRKEFDQGAEHPLIGVINNIKDWKGQHVAIEAMNVLKKTYPELKCVFVGNISHLEEDQTYYRYLQGLVAKYDLAKVTIFAGYRTDVIDVLGALDILLHVSLSREGFPRVILEIMLLGKPLIGSNVGATPEMIQDGVSGFLVPANNPEALAERIEYLITHQEVARDVGVEATKRVREHFNIAANVKKTEELYLKLLATK